MFSSTLPKIFSKLLKNNTREEFNEKYQVLELDHNYWALCDNKGHEIIPCPINTNCKITKNCKICWSNVIRTSIFKGEDKK